MLKISDPLGLDHSEYFHASTSHCWSLRTPMSLFLGFLTMIGLSHLPESLGEPSTLAASGHADHTCLCSVWEAARWPVLALNLLTSLFPIVHALLSVFLCISGVEKNPLTLVVFFIIILSGWNFRVLVE